MVFQTRVLEEMIKKETIYGENMWSETGDLSYTDVKIRNKTLVAIDVAASNAEETCQGKRRDRVVLNAANRSVK